MNSSIAIQILPKVEGNKEVVRVVDTVIDHIKQSGLHYQVGAFETSVEGDFDALMQLVKECHEIAIQAGSAKVSSYIKVVYDPSEDLLTIDEKTLKHVHS